MNEQTWILKDLDILSIAVLLHSFLDMLTLALNFEFRPNPYQVDLISIF